MKDVQEEVGDLFVTETAITVKLLPSKKSGSRSIRWFEGGEGAAVKEVDVTLPPELPHRLVPGGRTLGQLLAAGGVVHEEVAAHAHASCIEALAQHAGARTVLEDAVPHDHEVPARVHRQGRRELAADGEGVDYQFGCGRCLGESGAARQRSGDRQEGKTVAHASLL